MKEIVTILAIIATFIALRVLIFAIPCKYYSIEEAIREVVKVITFSFVAIFLLLLALLIKLF